MPETDRAPSSSTLFDNESLEASAQYVLEKARETIEKLGPRPPGSEAEAALQERVREELETYLDGGVEIEPFEVAQKAFMSLPWFSGTLLAFSLVGFWVTPWLGLLFSASGLATSYFELFRYKRFIDPLFPKRTSYNVIGVKKPTGPPKRRYILNSHPDAAYEWRFNYLCPRRFPLLLLYSLLGLFGKVALDASCIVLGVGWGVEGSFVGWLGLAHLVLLPGLLIGICYTNFSVVAPGANDNLSGVFISLAVAKLLREKNVLLEDTEIVYAVTGSEEAGLRGAKAYVERHGEELKDIETICVTLDTLRDLEHFFVYNKDMNGTVKHDPSVCRLLKESAAARGLDLAYASVHVGATDAAAFTQGGIRSGALCAMDPHPADFYHTRRDNWDNMNPECVRKAIEVVLESIRRYDAEGLPGGEERSS